MLLLLAAGRSYVGAQLPDLLVLTTQDVDDIGRDDYLESFHGCPWA